MFIARSAFWLTAAFIVMAPSAGMDLGSSARSTGEQLVSQGSQAAVSQLNAAECATFECSVGRSVLVGALGQVSSVEPTEASAIAASTRADAGAPVPPRRPDWAY